jgi:hypothetical protein
MQVGVNVDERAEGEGGCLVSVGSVITTKVPVEGGLGVEDCTETPVVDESV